MTRKRRSCLGRLTPAAKRMHLIQKNETEDRTNLQNSNREKKRQRREGSKRHIFRMEDISIRERVSESIEENPECHIKVTEEEIDDTIEESIVLPVNIETQNYRGCGQQRVRNNIRQIIEKEQNETHSRIKKKYKMDEEIRSHLNRMERERRLEIRYCFEDLASVMNDIPSKHSNAYLLNKAITVIKDLKEKERKSSQMLKELKEQKEILKQKLLKLQKLTTKWTMK